MAYFPSSKANESTTLYHSPICLDTEPQVCPTFTKRFKFENMWLTEPDLPNVVHENWPRGGDIDLVAKIATCTNELERWGHKIRMRFQYEFNESKRAFVEAMKSSSH